MKILPLVLASTLSLAAAAQAPAPAAGNSPFRWFAGLAGACWKGEHPDGKTGDIQCYSPQYDGRFMRGTIKVFRLPDAKSVVFEGDSVFGWDAAGSRIVYAQWVSTGSLTPGQEAYWDGDVLRFGNPADAKAAPLRSSWQKVDANTFKVVRERRDGADWKPVFVVTYRRMP